MKAKRNLFILLIFSFFLLVGPGCRVHQPHYHKKGMIISSRPSGKVPPGHMKKAMGAKSAKAFAPGQNKPHKYNKGKKGR